MTTEPVQTSICEDAQSGRSVGRRRAAKAVAIRRLARAVRTEARDGPQALINAMRWPLARSPKRSNVIQERPPIAYPDRKSFYQEVARSQRGGLGGLIGFADEGCAAFGQRQKHGVGPSPF
jgi:hypothetical protein